MKTLINLIIVITLMSSSLSSVAMKIYGHRGARGIAPENTIYGYNTALSVGVDYVDMDITMTKDGVLVVTHDSALNPDLTRDKKGNWISCNSTYISALSLEDVQSYNVGKLKPDTSYGRLFKWQKSEELDTCIPTLKQVIQQVKKVSGNKVGFQIEIKTDPMDPEASATPEELALALAIVLAEEHIIDRTEVQAFDWRCLIALKEINSEIQTAWLTEFDYLEKMLSDNPEEAGLWTAGHLLKNYDNSIPKMIAELGGTTWGPEDRQLTEELVKKAQELGLKVVVWSYPEATRREFDEDMMKKLLAWQVDGITTDYPDLLREIMAEQGYTLPEQFKVT